MNKLIYMSIDQHFVCQVLTCTQHALLPSFSSALFTLLSSFPRSSFPGFTLDLTSNLKLLVGHAVSRHDLLLIHTLRISQAKIRPQCRLLATVVCVGGKAKV